MESNRKKDPELADFLRNSIQKSGLTYEKVAEQLNISVWAVGYYCSGERKPGQKNIAPFCADDEHPSKRYPFLRGIFFEPCGSSTVIGFDYRI